MSKIAGNVLGTLGIGKTDAEKTQAQQMQMQREIIDRLDKIGIPEIEAQKIMLESPQLIGELIPELQGYVDQLGPSAFSEIEAPEGLKQSQISALNTLQERVDQGGLTETDKAEINQLNRNLMGKQKSNDEALLQNLAERGVLGSGDEIALRRASSQEARQTAAREAEARAALAQESKFNAAQLLGDMASSQRAGEYKEQSDKAQAADVINQFNLQNRTQARREDLGVLNQAQQANLQNKQAIENARVAAANQQETANKALIQQDYQNQLQKAGAISGAQQNAANALGQQAQGQQQGFNQLLSSGASLGATALMFSDKNLKVNVGDGNNKIEEMLDKLTSYDYNYKPGVYDDERHTGIMAQDLEKSELGDRFVEDTEMGKVVDYSKAMPTMMAGQANLNKRLRKLEKLLMGQE
jgi:hypothetical protein